MEDCIVVLNTGDPALDNNRAFDLKEAGKISHTCLPGCYLYQEALKAGIKFATPDVYFNFKTKPKKVFLISHLNGGPYIDRLMKEENITPLILTCQESPFIATRFYLGLKKISKLYKHSFVFSGMKKMLSADTIYHQMFFPQPYHLVDDLSVSYKDKKLLVVVAGAKGIGSLAKSLLLKLFYGFGVKEIYPERRKAIGFFSKVSGFDLYGHGWDKVNFKDLDNESIKLCYRGAVDDKIAALKKYRFVLCFENAIFPGYITEKIFDAMFAGCVPVYYGAPDIAEYVDEASFIDFRKFKNYQELFDYLSSIDEAEYNKYLANIRNYFNSDNYQKFTQEYYARQILAILKSEFQI